jgi:hypothetical protein
VDRQLVVDEQAGRPGRALVDREDHARIMTGRALHDRNTSLSSVSV